MWCLFLTSFLKGFLENTFGSECCDLEWSHQKLETKTLHYQHTEKVSVTWPTQVLGQVLFSSSNVLGCLPQNS